MLNPKPPAIRDGVEDYHSLTAEEFLDTLSPRHALWSRDPPAWIYRGHANAEWELKAKAVRNPAAFAEYGIRVAAIGPGQVPPTVVTWSDLVQLAEQAFDSISKRIGSIRATDSGDSPQRCRVGYRKIG